MLQAIVREAAHTPEETHIKYYLSVVDESGTEIAHSTLGSKNTAESRLDRLKDWFPDSVA